MCQSGPLLTLSLRSELIGWVASIPSPSFNTIDIGPRPLTLYGLMIGLGIIAATLVSRPRAIARRLHPDTPVEMLMWVVPAGVVGARLYHVITDWKPIGEWHEIWNGGLGIPGAIFGGAMAGLLFVKNRNISREKVADMVAPGLAIAQSIGRWGNWWNQELYGRPTDVPWALEIDAEHRVAGFAEFETFHPTFLYESLWTFGLFVFLIWLDRRKVLKPGKLIWVYTGVYAIGRLWIEALRIDNATEILGVRVNIWTMSAVLLFSLFMLRNGFRSADEQATSALLGNADEDGDAAAADDDYAEDEDTGRSDDAKNGSSGEEE